VLFALLAAGFALFAFGGLAARVKPPLDPSATFAGKVLAGLFAYVALRSVTSALGRADRAFIGVLLFTPVLLLAAGAPLVRHAQSESGEPLARAIAVTAPRGALRYEACYSPGTDYLRAASRRS